MTRKGRALHRLTDGRDGDHLKYPIFGRSDLKYKKSLMLWKCRLCDFTERRFVENLFKDELSSLKRHHLQLTTDTNRIRTYCGEKKIDDSWVKFKNGKITKILSWNEYLKSHQDIT